PAGRGSRGCVSLTRAWRGGPMPLSRVRRDRRTVTAMKTPFAFRLNPAWRDLPHCCAVLRGVASSYHVREYRTTLSLKSVTRRAACYRTPQGRHLVTEDSFLLLNHGQAYALEIEGAPPSETLCPFFQSGFVEHVAGCLASPAGRLLDEEEPPARTTDFCER